MDVQTTTNVMSPYKELGTSVLHHLCDPQSSLQNLFADVFAELSMCTTSQKNSGSSMRLQLALTSYSICAKSYGTNALPAEVPFV